MSYASLSNAINGIAQGRNVFGSSGLDIMNTMAQAQAGGGSTNSPYITRIQDPDSESGNVSYAANNPRLGPNGEILAPGGNLVQAGQVADNMIIDPSKLTYDPEFGVVTPQSNVRVGQDKIGPLVFAATGGLLGATALGAGLGGSGLTGEGSISSPDLFGGSVGADDWAPSMGDSGPPVTDLSVASGTQAPAPVTDLSIGGSPLQQLLGGNFSGAASGLLSGALSNPVTALGLLQMGRGLLGNHGTSSSTTSGSSKPAGGSGVPGAPVTQAGARPAWQPNPITAAQLQQYLGGH